jgi:hypothetical protein
MSILFKKRSIDERLAERKRIKARGIWLYILFHGILAFGTFTFLIDLGANALFEHHRVSIEFLITKVLQWFATGVFWGWFTWRIEYDSDQDEG